MIKCGLNACLWSPRFFLPVPESLFDTIEYYSWMSDTDQGEMFLNYFADPTLLPYLGVDVTEVLKDPDNKQKGGRIWLRWTRWPMGVRQSPYATTRMAALGMECIRGNPDAPDNIFGWVEVKLNLPSTPNYDPTQPWVSKRTAEGELAPDAYTFVDDGRNLGRTKKVCDSTTKTVASKENFLGEQDAARKRRDSSQNSGAWVGAIFRATEDTIGLLTSQEKWDKAKGIIAHWREVVKSTDRVNRKDLEKHRGFLVHVSMIYPATVPYLKGFHLTLQSWRPNRDSEGWKLPANDWIRLQAYWEDKGIQVDTDLSYEDVPDIVEIAPRLKTDIIALDVLFSDPHPPLRVVRSKRLKAAGISFVDASGSGVGSSTQGRKQGVSVIFGTSTAKESSNWRELSNLVESLEQEYNSGNLHNLELFLCTDNQIAERCFYKGNSNSQKLFRLILRLRKLELHGNFKLHVLHVAWTRMILQDTDELSRGTLQGLLQQTSFEDFLKMIPLDKSVLDRSPLFESWLEQWAPMGFERLKPKNWFVRGHDIEGWTKTKEGLWHPRIRRGCYLWTPPPAAAYRAIEELRVARHKRQDSTQIFVCPRLFISMWRSHLHKSADLIFEIPPKLEFWGPDMHEPLVLGCYFPTFKLRPWFMINTPFSHHVVKRVRNAFNNNEDAIQILKDVMKVVKSIPRMSAEKLEDLLMKTESEF